MRTFLLILLALLVGVGAYGYMQNPTGCKKLAHDLKADLITVYGKPAVAVSNTVTALWGGTNAAPAAPAMPNAPGTSAAPGATAAAAPPAAPAPPAPAPVAVTPAAPAAPTIPAVLANWHRPAVTPAQADWTWTTPDRIYKSVKIMKIEADQVTISHEEGVSAVQIWTLPSYIQKQLNYDPAAALAATAERKKGAPATEPATMPVPASPQVAAVTQSLAPLEPARVTETTDYAGALAQAKKTGQLILLHFTGSDWCYYCKMLEQEVMSTPEFSHFVTGNYILVTLDFPHNISLPDSLKQQNSELNQKFNVHGFPTLVVIDSNEKEIGRSEGYNPGSGPSAVIAELKSFGH